MTMNDTQKTQISAYVDGELPDNEAELLLRRLCREEPLRAEVDRYLCIGRAIRGESNVLGAATLRDRIAAQLSDSMPAVEPERAMQGSRYIRPVAGVAVAASVALLALFGLRQVSTDVPDVTSVATDPLRDAIAIEGAPSYTEPPAAEFVSDRPRDRLSQYLVQHGLQSPNIGSRLTSVAVRGDGLSSDDSAALASGDEDDSARDDSEANPSDAK